MDETPSDPVAPPGSDGPVSLDAIPSRSADLLTVLDTDRTVQYQSPSIKRLFGYGQDELGGQSVVDYVHPDDRQRVADSFRTLVTTDERTVESVEYRHETADGTYLWVESVGSSAPTPEGYYVLNTRDISRRKQCEQELRDANDRLEEHIRFVSHDLRNPLSIARGHLELATEDPTSEHHGLIAEALDRMDTLIGRLLADTEGEALTVDSQPVDLTDLSETCWQHVSTGESTLDATVDQPIRADRFRCKRLLENLFRNAIEHNDGTVRITIGALDDGFYIADNGSGIPDDDQEQVFESGYTTADTGTGFGLEIVSHVVDAHGWEIDLTESSAGGVRFEITDVELAAADSG